MSVECRIVIGLTIELDRNMKTFEKLHDLEDKYPELEDDNYHISNKEGRLLLIYDGMCSEFARLVQVDKYIDGGSLGDTNEFIELPNKVDYDNEIVKKMFDIYKEYTGKKPDTTEFKYAMWSQWY